MRDVWFWAGARPRGPGTLINHSFHRERGAKRSFEAAAAAWSTRKQGERFLCLQTTGPRRSAASYNGKTKRMNKRWRDVHIKRREVDKGGETAKQKQTKTPEPLQEEESARLPFFLSFFSFLNLLCIPHTAISKGLGSGSHLGRPPPPPPPWFHLDIIAPLEKEQVSSPGDGGEEGEGAAAELRLMLSSS